MFTGEDAAGPIALGLLGILVTVIIAAIIDVLQKPIKNILEKCRCLLCKYNYFPY